MLIKKKIQIIQTIIMTTEGLDKYLSNTQQPSDLFR